MITIERMNPTSAEDAQKYLDLLERAKSNPEVTRFLPEIFDEGTVDEVRKNLSLFARYLVRVDDLVMGRVQFDDGLNDDPSVLDKVPEGVLLGQNTCYFINPGEGLNRNIEAAHAVVARLSIHEAFRLQGNVEVSPWLPVADGDPSRGWLMQNSTDFEVHAGEPQTGWFPQFDVADEVFRLAYATPAVAGA